MTSNPHPNIPTINFLAQDFNTKLAELFNENGFVVVENVFDEKAVREMQEEMRLIVDGMDPDEHPKSVFSTEDEEKVRLQMKNVW